MKPVEFYRYEEVGYQKLFSFNSWRIAILNYIEELEPQNIEYLECHKLTDEAFILLEGEAVIFIFEDDKIVPYKLNKNEVCNIKAGVYHTHILSEDCKLLIVEEESTSYENSHRIYINEEQRKQIEKVWRKRDAL